MVVDHASGEMTGEVLQGRYAGRAIEELDLEALLAVRRECTRADPQGAKVVETYLDRHHPGWDGGESDSGATSDRARPEATGEMGAKEALEVLGLSSEATDDEIVEAHRRLMQKVHPGPRRIRIPRGSDQPRQGCPAGFVSHRKNGDR